MSAAEVLARARAAGVRLRLAGDGRLRVAGRPEDVPPDLLAGLREHKAELAGLLRDEAPPPGPDPDDVAALAGILDAFPGAEVSELRLADPFGRLDLQARFPDADVVPLGTGTPADAALEPWTWSLPLPPKRTRPREPRPEPARLSGPDPTACRFCGEPCDVRETGGDPDGGFSHLECWAKAGHPDVGYAALFASTGRTTSSIAAEPCKHCGFPISWERDGVPFLDGTCAHVACYRRAEDRPEVPPVPPPSVDALAWARERADGFELAALLRASGRTDVSALVAELRDAGFGKAGGTWREGAGRWA